MKKWITIIAVILILFVGFSFLKTNSDMKLIQTKMEHHLDEKGYSSGDYQLKVSYHWENKLLGYSPYNINVIFSNESKVNYYYHYNTRTAAITQAGIAPMEDTGGKDFKHVE